jgi:hypothetical protein
VVTKQQIEIIEKPYKGEGRLHIDESGRRNTRYSSSGRAGGRKFWRYRGITSCRKYYRVTAGVLLQFCWAHLIWEVLFLLKLEEAGVRRYGRRILKQARAMFETIHLRGEMEEGDWKERMGAHREKIVRRATGTAPEQKDARLIAERMREREEEYFRFIEAGIEATNNPGELTIRQSIVGRVVTQGGSRQRVARAVLECVYDVYPAEHFGNGR